MISFVKSMVILYIALFLFLVYSILIGYYWVGWRSIPEYIPKQKNYSTTISVIIPARNEEENIGRLLNALKRQTYPQNLCEIIVVNDHSDDKTAEVVRQFPNVILLELNDDPANSYKKKAIEQGINAASGKLILTTDADCITPLNWLETVISFYEEKNPVFIAAPVILQGNSTVIHIFQTLDFLVLQGIAGASVHKHFHSMCNGANLAYEKKAFEDVKGFGGIDHIASGDDMLLMHKIWKKFPGRVNYLKSKKGIVSTAPMKTWKEFFNQRIRWASKAGFYDDKRILWVLVLVYLFNLSFLALLVAGFWLPVLWLYFLALWIAKTIIEFPFVYSVSKFFNKVSLVKYFFLFQPLHITYTIAAGWLSQFRKYEWKGRMVR